MATKKKQKKIVKKAVESQSPVSLAALVISKIVVFSASLKDRKLNVTYQKNYQGLSANAVTEECGNEVHNDMVVAFSKLRSHFAIICDMKESETNGVKLHPSEWEAPILGNIRVTGFILKGEGNSQSIQIVGQKKINNRVLCMNSPLLKFDDKQFPYEFLDELKESLADIDKEIHLYLSEGKFAPPSQTVMELEEENDDEREGSL